MDWSKTKIRCSSLGALMSEPKEKKAKEAGELSESAKGELIKIYAKEKYGRDKIVYTKQMAKGTLAEEESLTLIARVTKKMLRKNTEHLSNDYIQGTPDIYEGENIRQAKEINFEAFDTDDAKSAWDLFTFLPRVVKPVPKANYWQLQGYFALTGAVRGNICYTLVDTPDNLIEAEKWRLLNRMDVASEESDEFKKAFAPILLNMKVSDIPKEERLLKFPVEKDINDILRIYKKVEKAREWLEWFEDKHVNFNKTTIAIP